MKKAPWKVNILLVYPLEGVKNSERCFFFQAVKHS